MSLSYTAQKLLAAMPPSAGRTVDAGNPFVAARQKGMDALHEFGIPTRIHEDWKYTGLRNIAEADWKFSGDQKLSKDLVEPHRLADRVNIVTVNGRWNRDLSDPISDLRDVQVSFLDNESRFTPEQTRICQAWELNPADAVERMSLAMSPEMIIVSVGRGVDSKSPVHFVHVICGKQSVAASRTVVELGDHASLSVSESFVQIGAAEATLSINAALIRLGSGANCKYWRDYQLVDEAYNLGQTKVVLGRDSQFKAGSFGVGGAISRHEMRVEFDQPGAQAELSGLYMPVRKQHADHYVVVDHKAPHCRSSQLYKGILDDHGRGVFNGRVLVRRLAQQTNAEQLNRNLLLSPNSEVDARPQLEIDADDVKCSHGAAIGQLNQDEVFYLRSRGIPLEHARAMLSRAFAEEVVMLVQDGAIRARWDAMLDRHFSGRV
jgi:Fe-S cluster assembly protein SufD